MRRFISSCFATLALLAVAQLAQAQVFYSQDFSSGTIPVGWSTTDASGNNVLWEYCAGPSSGCVNLGGAAEFASTSADNGFLVLDSDGAGNIPSNHVSQLKTGAINCSGKTTVFATFENYIGIYEVPSDMNVLFQVSTDGTNWTSYNFTPGLGTNDLTDNPLLANIDITAVAANKPIVFLRWQWTGHFEYWWFLDDVNLTSEDPTPANNLAVTDFFYPVSSFATPVSQMATDTFAFFGFVSNKGNAPQTNVKLKAQVINKTSGAVLFSDSASIASLEAGYLDSMILLPNTFAPALPTGTYSIKYTVSADNTDDAFPSDNVDGDDFLVTASTFSKENTPTGALRPGGGGDYSVANLYQMSSASLEHYKAAGLEFAAATNPDFPLASASVTAYLFRVSDDVLPDWSNFDGAEFLDPNLDIRGLASFSFPAGATNYTVYPIPLADFNTSADGVSLDNGARYMATIVYENESNVAFQAYGDQTLHPYFISSLVFTTNWFTGGFGDDYNATIRMIIELATSTDETPLPESAMNIFPNPVKDVLNLEVAFEQPTDATITIAEMSGRVINIDNRKGLTNEVLNYNLPQLAAGTYLARIATKTGTKTKKFVVVK